MACLRLIPEALDFGEVENTTGRKLRVQVTNLSGSLRQLTSSPAPPGFALSPSVNAISLSLPPQATRTLEVEFRPLDSLLHVEQLEVNAGPDCVATLPLRGLGSGSVSTAPLLDFGFLPPGQPRTLELTLVNTRRATVTVNSLRLDSNFTQAFSAPLPARVDLLPMSSISFPVTALAPTDDTFVSHFTGITPFGLVHTLLQVVGGAPVAELSETQLMVPRVGFAPSSFAERAVILRNVSNSGRSREAQLRLIAPFFTVEALDGGAIDELGVNVRTDANAGLTLGAWTEVLLRLTPTSLGGRSYRVTLFTNDPVHPEQRIFFATHVESLPPCELMVDPASELRLEPTPDGGSEGTVTFRNPGANACVVDDVRLTAVTPATFWITGTQAQVTIAAGATHVVTVHGPRGSAQNDGALGFHVFNANSVWQFVRLRTPP